MVAIKRTQLETGRKLKATFYGPYVIEKVKNYDTYDVKSVGLHQGPQVTSSCAEYMKPYLEKDLSEADDWAGCPVVGRIFEIWRHYVFKRVAG